MKKLIAMIALLAAVSAYAALADKVITHGAGTAAVKSAAVGSQSTCSALNRGTVFNVEGASGAADVWQVCLKAANNTYSWTTK